MKYEEFLQTKIITNKSTGIKINTNAINPVLFDFQKDIVRWALRMGKAAIFSECGTGKTFMQLEWAKHINGNVLILAPLAVAQQTIEEGKKINIDVAYCRNQGDVNKGITITNYEIIEHFDASYFDGVVLDESSILKSFMGKTKRLIIDKFKNVAFKLACTATPSPNDYLELGNHSDFLDVMPSNEMISRFFINDTMQAGNYRLKKYAVAAFWEWIASWAVSLSKPSDLGYSDDGFILPALNIINHTVSCSHNPEDEGTLFPIDACSASELFRVLRSTAKDRCEQAAKLANDLNEYLIIWCNTNTEADMLKKLIPDNIEVRGIDTLKQKEDKLIAFTNGKHRIIITKPSIAGFGLNWQHCHNVIFVGLTYSYEQLYQAIRRSWRFGQKREVNVHIISTNKESNVVESIKSKKENHEKMQNEMVNAMKKTSIENINQKLKLNIKYDLKKKSGNGYVAYKADCIDVLKDLKSDSVDFTIYSPPFANIYIYSDNIRDMGNTKNDAEFYGQYKYLIQENLRVTRPGRLIAVHCKNLVKYIGRDGVLGLKDFRGEIIRMHEAEGWQYHSEVCIWKDPVVEMQRTKSHGLLHKQVVKDSTFSRQGVPDYLVIFRKWNGEPEEVRPVKKEGGFDYYVGQQNPRVNYKDNKRLYSIQVWQRYASPVWFDIKQTNVLNIQQAREDKDEKHICPLQLDVIEKAIHLWTNPGDTVLSPFMGIGSEGYVALKQGRKFIGIELKESYFQQAVLNLNKAIRQSDMFAKDISYAV